MPKVTLESLIDTGFAQTTLIGRLEERVDNLNKVNDELRTKLREVEQKNTNADDGIRYHVYLKDGGFNKINVIKEVRAFTNLGLKEAKDLVEAAGPLNIVRSTVPAAEAYKVGSALRTAGATVEVAMVLR